MKNTITVDKDILLYSLERNLYPHMRIEEDIVTINDKAYHIRNFLETIISEFRWDIIRNNINKDIK